MARLHFIGGGTLDVDQEPEDAARMLWSAPQPDSQGAFDAHDMGYAALQKGSKALLVNPAAVAYIERSPNRSAVAGFH